MSALGLQVQHHARTTVGNPAPNGAPAGLRRDRCARAGGHLPEA